MVALRPEISLPGCAGSAKTSSVTSGDSRTQAGSSQEDEIHRARATPDKAPIEAKG